MNVERPQFETPGGKTLEIFTDPTGLYAFRFTSGGELPVHLKARFTHMADAERHAEAYIQQKEERQAAKQDKASEESNSSDNVIDNEARSSTEQKETKVRSKKTQA